ncbi:MAG: MarR family winged helix-turn-helix transcriptional regulator [Collimonas sp.]|uniref:MarR family winged helix-turn-helix transcriptional regulator n=1 Tax=Collimonas sp. TaxID=1963772 RepID=UPI0032667325
MASVAKLAAMPAFIKKHDAAYRCGGSCSAHAQWDALQEIGNRPESSSHKLASLTFQTDQFFGALAIRIADRGLIPRTAGTGKALLHHLTPVGESMLRNGHIVVNKVLADSLAPLTAAERQQLQALLSRLLD